MNFRHLFILAAATSFGVIVPPRVLAQDTLPQLHPAGEIVVEEEIPATAEQISPQAAEQSTSESPKPLPETSPAPGTEEKPSAELIIDAEEAVVAEPAMQPGEDPLPPMDNALPGDMNIFGADLFGPGAAGASVGAADFQPPPRLPDLQDAQELQRKTQVRFRRVAARLERDPQISDLQEMARQATTPEDRRAARRAYYTLLYEKARQIDKTLTDYTDSLEKKAIARLAQTRIEPTIPLNAPPPPPVREKFQPKPQYPLYEPLVEERVALP